MKVTNDRPKYRITERAFIDEVLLDPDSMPIDRETGETAPLIINYDGAPEYYMEPMNELAQKMKDENPRAYVDPINSLTTMNSGEGKTAEPSDPKQQLQFDAMVARVDSLVQTVNSLVGAFTQMAHAQNGGNQPQGQKKR